jgi:hypothetical protein
MLFIAARVDRPHSVGLFESASVKLRRQGIGTNLT